MHTPWTTTAYQCNKLVKKCNFLREIITVIIIWKFGGRSTEPCPFRGWYYINGWLVIFGHYSQEIWINNSNTTAGKCRGTVFPLQAACEIGYTPVLLLLLNDHVIVDWNLHIQHCLLHVVKVYRDFSSSAFSPRLLGIKKLDQDWELWFICDLISCFCTDHNGPEWRYIQRDQEGRRTASCTWLQASSSRNDLHQVQ